jgi:poly-gamma-glutamate synthesis protein (capsule biosynthesis protein)
MFKYTKEHFHGSDLSIGVFEGPTAGGEAKDYSTSNYGDGIRLYLNFLDEFVEAVKNSGINFVTTSNKHLLDKGIKGAMRALDILDKYNISHIGFYRNEKEKKEKELQIININGVKIAFLAYSQFINYNSAVNLYLKLFDFIHSY